MLEYKPNGVGEIDMFVNLTPHAINILVDGNVVTIEPSGEVARVESIEKVTGEINGITVVSREFGDVHGLPEEGTPCIVSAMVLGAVPGRKGVYAPDSGPTAVRNEKGHIVHVTRLVQA